MTLMLLPSLRRFAPRALGVFLLFAVTPPFAERASAHDTWFLPKIFRLKPEQRTEIALTSGMRFPKNDHAIKAERISQAFLLLAGEKIQFPRFEPRTAYLGVPFAPSNVGVATAFVELAPRTLELSPKQVREYLREIGAPDSLQAFWKNVRSGNSSEGGARWRETYSKHAKTFLFVGDAASISADSSWKTPVGMKIEIVPERHPGLLKANDELPIRVLLDGKSLENFAVGYLRENDRHGRIVRTDAEGRARIRLGKAGRYLLRGTLLQVSTSNDEDWRSYFTTLTLEVRRS
jgi:hypothetical protein